MAVRKEARIPRRLLVLDAGHEAMKEIRRAVELNGGRILREKILRLFPLAVAVGGVLLVGRADPGLLHLLLPALIASLFALEGP